MSEQRHSSPGTAWAAVRSQTRQLRTELQVLAALVALCGYFIATQGSTFASSSNFDNMVWQGSILFVVAAGQMFALIVGGFDLSVAANMGFASTVSALVMQGGGSPATAILVGVASGAAVGAVNGFVIAYLKISPFVATLGMLTFLSGFANRLAHGQSVSGLHPDFISWLGSSGGSLRLPSAAFVAIGVLVVSWFVASRHRIGLYIYAVGGSDAASRLAGVRVASIVVLAYTLCGTLASLAGLLLSARVGIGQAALGQTFDLLSIAAAVIGGVAIGGGVGRLSGVILGVALFTVLTTGLNIAAVDEFTQQMITGAVLVLAVLLAQLQGAPKFSVRSLLGRATRAPDAPAPGHPAESTAAVSVTTSMRGDDE
ncbi:MAG: ABC transporter permease [Nocardioidaceae bacterium]|nr:ABC transporter permease [Nocardioidaceae bacterium]